MVQDWFHESRESYWPALLYSPHLSLIFSSTAQADMDTDVEDISIKEHHLLSSPRVCDSLYMEE